MTQKKLVILDNYDSFTYNLVHYFEALGLEVEVFRNDEVQWDAFDRADYIVLSPGPGLPQNASNLMETIAKYSGVKPILGVCLGMQALALSLGGELKNQEQVKHGKQEELICHQEGQLYKHLPKTFKVGLYHSWEVVEDALPIEVKRTAFSEHKVLMSFEHTRLQLFAVQFHPESILSEYGMEILRNFIA